MAEGNTPLQNPIDAKLETEYGKKLDLNNANMRSFVDYRGLYPTLARKIIKNAPFDKVEDVMDMPGLSDREKEILQANLENFTVTEQSNSFTEGDDRINNGVYD
jgi:photosystem II PsbU protein